MRKTELDIAVIPLLKDNYGYLLHDPATGLTGAVDPSEAQPMLDAAASRGWKITHILNTHHHNDHCGGNLGIKQATGAKVVGPAYDRDRIPGIDIAVDGTAKLVVHSFNKNYSGGRSDDTQPTTQTRTRERP